MKAKKQNLDVRFWSHGGMKKTPYGMYENGDKYERSLLKVIKFNEWRRRTFGRVRYTI